MGGKVCWLWVVQRVLADCKVELVRGSGSMGGGRAAARPVPGRLPSMSRERPWRGALRGFGALLDENHRWMLIGSLVGS